MNNNKYSIFILFVSIFFSANAQYTSSDWKSRDKWMKINNFLDLSSINTNYIVADIGSHEGYLTMHLASRVGKKGKVYAVDVRNDRLENLKSNARKRKINNITTILGDYDNPKLPINKLNIVFVIDTYHEINSYKKVLGHIFKSLKPGGKLVLLEKLKKRVIGKSREVQIAAHSLSPKYVKKELQEAGFIIKKEVENFGYWERDKSKQMWILIAAKP